MAAKRSTPSVDDQTFRSEERRFYPEKELLSWMAPSRPFKKKDRQFWVTTTIVLSVIALILFLVEGIMPVILIVSLVFLFYVLTTVEPETVHYKITNKGVRIAGVLTRWNDLLAFWFTTRMDSTLLVLETVSVPGRLELIITPTLTEKIKQQLSKYIPEEERPPSYFDRAVNWISLRLPSKKAF